MALPKTRVSRQRRGERRSHMALKQPNVELCPHCRRPKLNHRICPNCGHYKGREVIETS